ncbi:MAG TPA: MBL fold metallo-hydrolase [Actinobacteria bacterium]|nr:MBL fold metallo-hydrolase [Actinomycetota bacterium]
MRISFHGANRDVTGSCHLIEFAGTRVLIDCGMFQGGRRLHEENSEPFGFDPAAIDVVLLTHAHLDHCGRLPLLVKRGFRGEIVTTAASRELAQVVLLDSASLHEEEAKREERTAARRGETQPVEPLYTTLDALNTFELFGRTAGYGEPITLAPNLDATFLDAGHILGSATIVIESTRNGTRHVIAFSGDIGNDADPLLRSPVTPPGADAVVMETTYGDRLHKPIEPSVQELYDAVTGTLDRGGNVIIPTFALERAQQVLFFLALGVTQKRLPRALQVYLDSPMAISATEIYRRHPEGYDPEVAEMFREGRDPFALPGLHFTRESAQSRVLNDIHGGVVIMAGSGMATGGRVLHHLKHNVWRSEASVVLVGFAARGTLARRLVDGADRVGIFGEEIPVRARIHTINGFSAHADRDELLGWHRAIAPERTFLVHGEEGVMEGFSKLLEAKVTLPRFGESFEL